MPSDKTLPPYFALDPKAAVAALAEPAGTEEFAAIAAACTHSRDDLAARGMTSDPTRQLRLFSTWEITRYLIPVAQGHFRRVLKQNPDLPQGQSQTPGAAKWFTLEEVLRLKAHFDQEGVRSKGYLPYRPEGRPAKICAVANLASGVGKTTTAAHLAMSAALDGYKVLVIDLDPQGAMTLIFGAGIADEWQTVFPLLARHYAQYLRADNQRRLDRGDTPIPLDDTLGQSVAITAQDLVRTTHWPHVDLIGAQLNLARAEFQMPAWRMQGRGWKPWEALAERLDADGILDAYDVVMIDTPPALGHLTICGLVAADIVLVPLGASASELEASGRFFDMLHMTFESIEETENLAARALGREETRFHWDAVRTVITRYDGAQQAECAALMEARLGRALSPHRQGRTALVGSGEGQLRGIYEADYRDFNRETYVRARETFDATYAAFKQLLIGAWHRDLTESG